MKRLVPVASGFVLLELLLVLVVIAVLAGGFFAQQRGSSNSQSTYQMSMSRSSDAACKANRAVLRSQIEMFRINNPNVPITTENLQKAGTNPATCPNGGSYGFMPDGRIICNKHPDEPAAK